MVFYTEMSFFFLEAFLLSILNQDSKKSSTLSYLIEKTAALHTNFYLHEQDKFTNSIQTADEKYLVYLIDEAHFAGIPTHSNMQKLCNELSKADKTAKELQQLNLLMSGRILMLSLLALATRIASQAGSLAAQKTVISYDLLCLLASLLCSLSFLAIIKFYYPKSWFWHTSFSKEAEDWLSALFLKKVGPTSPIYSMWLKLEEIELSSGLSQAKQKKILIDLWTLNKRTKMQQKQALFKDYLPLMECTFLGFSVFFILVIPLWQMMGISY